MKGVTLWSIFGCRRLSSYAGRGERLSRRMFWESVHDDDDDDDDDNDNDDDDDGDDEMETES